MGYWSEVTTASWHQTKESFGWTKKTAATILLAAGAVLKTYLRLGWAGMTETATGYVWLGLAPILAGLILFAWNFIEAQAQIYEKLAISHRAEVSELQARLARFDEPTPNYEAWRHVNELKVKQAAFLWCEIEPRISQTPKVTAWANALEAAIKKGELGFVPKLSQYGSEAAQYIEQQKGAWSETIVTRDQLRSFAQAHGYDPIFLREA